MLIKLSDKTAQCQDPSCVQCGVAYGLPLIDVAMSGNAPFSWIGPKGDTGAQGPQGVAGPTGPAGPTGSTGPQGPIGLTGPAGAKGDTGNTGPTGATGSAGAQGIQGPAGATGSQAGAGGVITQATSKATAVTLNKFSGEITMNAAALAAGAIVSFTLTNSTIAATDVLVMNHVTTGTRGAYGFNAQCAAGSATIYVRNNSAASLSEAIVIRFAVVKAAIT
jgi:hypothetical protein